MDKMCYIFGSLETTGSGFATGTRLTAGSIDKKYHARNVSFGTILMAQTLPNNYMDAWVYLYYAGGSFIFDNRSGNTIKQIHMTISYIMA